MVQYRLPPKAPKSRWYHASFLVSRGGEPLRQYASRAALAEAATDGYVVHRKSLYLFRKLTGTDREAQWTLEYPRILRAWQVSVVCGGILAWTGLLLYARNPVAVRIKEHTKSLCHSALLCLTFGVATAAIALRVHGFSFPVWANDTVQHYAAVFTMAAGGELAVTPDRPFGLPLVMGLLLSFIPDLRAVVAAQAIATIVAAAAIGTVVTCSGRRIFDDSATRSFCWLLGILSFAAIAFNESILQREWALLAESWVAIYFGIQVLLAWYLTSRPHPLWRATVAYALFCAAGLLAFFTRPNWGLALAALPLPWLVASLIRVPGRRLVTWLATGAAVLGFMASLMFGYQRHCSRYEGIAALYDRARALLCWHVPLVLPEIERRIAADPPARYRLVLLEIAQLMDDELERAEQFGPGYYPSIGYNADHLYFRTLPKAPHFRQLPLDERAVLCSELFKGAFLRRPHVYLYKVVGQMSGLFRHPYDRPRISISDVKEALIQSVRAANEVRFIPSRIRHNYKHALSQAEQELIHRWPSRARLALSLRSTMIFEWLTASFAWTVVVSLVICAAAAIRPRWRAMVPWSTYTPVVCVAVWSLSSVLLSALTSALVQGLDIQRYIDLFMPLTLLSHVLWPLIAASVLVNLKPHAGPRV